MHIDCVDFEASRVGMAETTPLQETTKVQTTETKFGPEFKYNGFTVQPIGPKQFGRGGVTQRVRIVGSPEIKWDREFSAVVGG